MPNHDLRPNYEKYPALVRKSLENILKSIKDEEDVQEKALTLLLECGVNGVPVREIRQLCLENGWSLGELVRDLNSRLIEFSWEKTKLGLRIVEDLESPSYAELICIMHNN